MGSLATRESRARKESPSDGTCLEVAGRHLKGGNWRLEEGDPTYPCVRHGRSVRVDLAALKPIDPATVSALADAARSG